MAKCMEEQRESGASKSAGFSRPLSQAESSWKGALEEDGEKARVEKGEGFI